MIQEILDCLLIKKEFLTLSKEEILEKLNNESTLAYYCKSISKVLEYDYFFFTSNELMEKLETIFEEKRFSSKHSKEVVEDLNHMLDAIHKYHNMSVHKKNIIKSNWIQKEKQNRLIPLSFYYNINESDLHLYMKLDYDNLIFLIYKNAAECINSSISILNTMYWLCNSYPEILAEYPEILENCKFVCYCINCQANQGSFDYIHLLRKTERKLKKIENSITKDKLKKQIKIIK